MRKMTIVIALSAALGLTAPGLASAGVLSSPDHALVGQLIYTTAAPGDVQTIWHADRHGVVPLTHPGDYCCLARLAPDHRSLLVMPGGDAGVPATGGKLSLPNLTFTRLTLHDLGLNLIPQAWSPDGRWIAFEGWDDSDQSRTGVYLARASDGSHLRRVTVRTGAAHDTPLDFSPDGRRLVVYRSVHADPDPVDIGGSLWVVDVGGGQPRRLTDRRSPPASWARWSPDGSRIVFASERLQSVGRVWTVEPANPHPRVLFRDVSGRFPITPAWSPDGSHLVLGLDPTNDEFQHPANGLYVIDGHGRQLRLLVGGDDFKRFPEWYS